VFHGFGLGEVEVDGRSFFIFGRSISGAMRGGELVCPLIPPGHMVGVKSRSIG
jgi:hypothetical protein